MSEQRNGGSLVGQWHDASRAAYDKVSEAHGHLKNLRLELDSLLKLGDLVSSEDVIKSAANLVGKGFGPQEMATMLSDMPEGGEALGQWVAMHDQGVKEMEQRAGGMVGAARHQMGLSAAHVLMGHGGPGGGAGGAVAGARGVALPMRGTDGGPMGIGPLAGTAGAGIA